MTDDEGLQLVVDGPVARVSLAKPSRGCPLDLDTCAELRDALAQVRAAGSHVLVLSSRGTAFSVGGNLAQMAAADDRETYVSALLDLVHGVVQDLHALDTVVVSAVNGVAAGAGFPLAAAADLVLASESARFTLAYTKAGLSPDGGTTLLTRTLGLHRVLRLALLNPVLSAQEAYETGLVASVHPDDELDAAVDEVVAALVAGSRSAQVSARHVVRAESVGHVTQALEREAHAMRRACASPDGLEGVAAFLAKRPPQFGGSG